MKKSVICLLVFSIVISSMTFFFASCTQEQISYQYEYDGSGRLVTAVSLDGKKTQIEYNEEGQPTKVKYSGGTVSYGYDANGNRIWMKDPEGVSEYFYDPFDRLTGYISLYDLEQMITYTYDSLNNVTSIKVFNISAMEKNDKYKNKLNDLAVKKPEKIKEWKDQELLLQQVADMAAGEALPELQKWQPYSVQYGYDALGNISEVKTNGESVLYSYQSDIGKTTRTLPNGIKTDFNYSKTGSLDSLSHFNSNGQLIADYKYEYNAAGNVTKVMEQTEAGLKTTGYSWNSLGYLSEIANPDGSKTTYTYDEMGNRLTEQNAGVIKNYTYDDYGKLISAGDSQYKWDANGFLTTQLDGKDKIKFKYNSIGLPVSIKSPEMSAAYKWDGDGNMLSSGSGKNTLHYLNNPFTSSGSVLAEFDKDGKPKKSYLYGETLLGESGNEDSLTFFLEDGLNSIRAITNNTGKITGQADYTPFAEQKNVAGTVDCSFRTAGERFLSGINKYFVGNRLYDASAGRYLSPDPESGYLERYDTFNQYTHGSPYDLKPKSMQTANKTAIALTGSSATFNSSDNITGAFIDSSVNTSQPNTPKKTIILFFGGMLTFQEKLEKDNSERFNNMFYEVNALGSQDGNDQLKEDIGIDLNNYLSNNISPEAKRMFEILKKYPANEYDIIIVNYSQSVVIFQNGTTLLCYGQNQKLFNVIAVLNSGGAPYEKSDTEFKKSFGFDPLYYNLPGDSVVGIENSFYAYRAGAPLPPYINIGVPYVYPNDIQIGISGGRFLNSVSKSGFDTHEKALNYLIQCVETYVRQKNISITKKTSTDTSTSIVRLNINPSRLTEPKKIKKRDYDYFFPFPPNKPNGGGVAFGPYIPNTDLTYHDPPDKNGGCAGVNPFITVEKQLGGIKLNPDVEFTGDLGNITGAVYDPEKQIFVLLSDENQQSNGLSIKAEDFAVALELVFGENAQDPSFTLDPYDPQNVKGEFQRAVYMPDEILSGTSFGKALFEADYLLKQYSMGVQVDKNGNVTDRVSSVPGFKSKMDIMLQDQNSANGESSWARSWIVPDVVRIKKADNSVAFDEVKMRVNAMTIVPDPSDPQGFRDVEADDPLAKGFAASFTDLYNQIALESPEFERLKDLTKAVALAKWMKEMNIPVNMDWVEKYASKNVETVVKVPALSNEKTVTTQDGNTIYTYTASMFGGVDLALTPDYINGTKEMGKLEETVSAKLNDAAAQSVFTVDLDGKQMTASVIPLTDSGQEFYSKAAANADTGIDYDFNENGKVISSTGDDGSKGEYGYDESGKLKAVTLTDSSGWKANGERKADGSIWLVTNPKGNVFNYIYNSSGSLSKTELNGKTYSTVETSADGLTTTVNYGDYTEKYTRDSASKITGYEIQKEDSGNSAAPGIKTASYSYDSAGNLTGITANGTALYSVSYAQDNVSPLTIKTPQTEIQYAYNSDGSVKQISSGDSNYSVIDNGNETKTLQIVSRDKTAEFIFGSDGILQSTDLLGGKSMFAYRDGNLSSVTMDNGKEAKYAYDAKGRLLEIRFPNKSWIEYKYEDESSDSLKMNVKVIQHPKDAA